MKNYYLSWHKCRYHDPCKAVNEAAGCASVLGRREPDLVSNRSVHFEKIRLRSAPRVFQFSVLSQVYTGPVREASVAYFGAVPGLA